MVVLGRCVFWKGESMDLFISFIRSSLAYVLRQSLLREKAGGRLASVTSQHFHGDQENTPQRSRVCLH